MVIVRVLSVYLCNERRLLSVVVVIAELAVLIAPWPGLAQTNSDFARDDLRFYHVKDGRGFTIANEGPRRLLNIYLRLGDEWGTGPTAGPGLELTKKLGARR